jgi:outer membrane protein TolC
MRAWSFGLLQPVLVSGLLLPVGALAPAASGDAAPAPGSERSSALARCIEMAERNHPNIWAARARLKAMEAQLDEARWAPFSQFTLSGGLGLAPTLRGNALYSPNTDVSLSSSMGLGWRIGFDGLIPIWTFGKLSSLSDAAQAQAQVGEGDIVKQKGLVRMDVRKAFFGLQLARDSLQLVGDVISKLDTAVEHIEKEIAADNADPIDALRLRTLRFELEGRQAEARRFEAIALASLRFLVGQPTGFDVPDEALRPTTYAIRIYHESQPRCAFDKIAQLSADQTVDIRTMAELEALLRVSAREVGGDAVIDLSSETRTSNGEQRSDGEVTLTKTQVWSGTVIRFKSERCAE